MPSPWSDANRPDDDLKGFARPLSRPARELAQDDALAQPAPPDREGRPGERAAGGREDAEAEDMPWPEVADFGLNDWSDPFAQLGLHGAVSAHMRVRAY